MQRFHQYGRLDDAPLGDAGDLAFLGLDMRAPGLVRPGFVSSAKNKRIVEGVYETRRGLFSPAWVRHCSEDFPYRDSYYSIGQSGADDTAWEAIYGTETFGWGRYSDPDEDTWIVRVMATCLILYRETEVGRIIPFLPNLEVDGPVCVRQNFSELIITRGGASSSLYWSGSWSDAVEELVPDSVASGYAAVPPAHYCLAWRGRTVFLADRDDLILSRLADSTQYHTTDGIFRVNEGRGDRLRAVAPLGASSLLVLKSHSVHVFTAQAADLSDARLDEQPIDCQFDSPHTAIAADGLVWWLDRRGVRTARIGSIDADGKILLQVNSQVSDPIAPLIRRIQWQHAAEFTAAVTAKRIYFAVALDDQTSPQTLLVWNRELQAWESYDQWDSDTLTFDVQALIGDIPWQDEPRLFAGSSGGLAACLEYGLGEDEVGWSGDYWLRANIEDELATRAYLVGTSAVKLFQRVQVHLETLDPGAIEHEAQFDGPGESLDLGYITRNATKFFTTAADFYPYNLDGRFHDPHRQDYGVHFTSSSPSLKPSWAEGNSYALNYEVFNPYDGHEYKALVGGVLSSLGNAPDAAGGVGETYWEADGNATTEPAWADGAAYVAGDAVSYYGFRKVARLSHTSAAGNLPGTTGGSGVWQDLGESSLLKTQSIYLGEGDGIRLEDYQSAVERRELKREAAWCKIVLRSLQGSVRVCAVELEVSPGPHSNLVHA